MDPFSSSLSTSSSSKRKMDPNPYDEPIRKMPKYDVFVSYSFEDIGKSFISHAQGALRRRGFAISDHTKLPKSHEECFELVKAIEESEIYVIVFSVKYGSSVRCLDELVEIMDCKLKFDQKKVLPVFFNVEPSDVRNQHGPFKEAFEAHETNFDHRRVQKWRQALKDVGQLSGHHFKNEDEENFICEVVKKLESMQNPQELHVTDHPAVGIESRVEKLVSSLRLDSEDVFIVAVLGISGIGKTTIAKATFNRIAAKFDAHGFLADIHYSCGNRNWKVDLQKELISCLSQNDVFPKMMSFHNDGVSKIRKLIRGQRVLLVLDDVDNFEQLKALGIDPVFFQNGSRIIVTTRDKRSLGRLPYVPHNIPFLDQRESIELFTRLTYERGDPIDEDFVNEIADCASGLPLVLEVWSRHFRHYEREHWPSVLKTLKAIPHDDVQKQLQMSYDSLPNRAKKLFLDIACFFVGCKKDEIVKVLQDEDLAFFPDHEIQRLADRGLVNVSYGYGSQVRMNHAIWEMGQEVVRQENEDEPGKRSRLMNDRDVVNVLTECLGTESVESISLQTSISVKSIYLQTSISVQGPIFAQVETLRKMRNLRLIRLDGVALSETCCSDDMPPFSFKKLKYLEWHEFPLRSINIDMCNVVVVQLQYSKLEVLWEGFKSLNKLRILDVSYSVSLTKTENLSGLRNLEYLRFGHCSKLEDLDNSVCCFEKLVELDLTGCENLTSLPSNMSELTSLRELDLFYCTKLGIEDPKCLMKLTGLTSLETLNMEYCNVSQVPCEIRNLVSLRNLNLSGNTFSSLPNSFRKLSKLQGLYIMDCKCLTTLPSNMSELTSLRELDLGKCTKLGIEDPECLTKVTGLTSLEILNMENCKVSQVPCEIGNLVSLRKLYLSGNTFSSLPNSLRKLSQLDILKLNDCSKLTLLPLLPPKLRCIDAMGWSLDVMSRLTTDIYRRPKSMCNSTWAYDFISHVFQVFGIAPFTSRLKISLPDSEVPNWCHYRGIGDSLSFTAPPHLDRKICGMVLVLSSSGVDSGLNVKLHNKTKEMSIRLPCVYFHRSSMCVMFYPPDDITLMVEAGDNLVLDCQNYGNGKVLGCGCSMIYECDDMKVFDSDLYLIDDDY